MIKVYDGDTITIANYLPNTPKPLYRFAVRLRGIDCPEMKTKDPNERNLAIIARDKLSNLIMNKIVTLKDVMKDKCGRVLAYVNYGSINTSEWLLQRRLAVKYDGGFKVSPKNWMKFYKG